MKRDGCFLCFFAPQSVFRQLQWAERALPIPAMNNTVLMAHRERWLCAKPVAGLFLLALLSIMPSILLQAQCGAGSGFTKITNTGGTSAYPGTNGSASVNVTTTSTGDVSVISFCNITNGFRAGINDRGGAFKFSFSPAVNGILINLNSLSNTPNVREVVRLKINDAFYNITAANVVCAANCFGCSGTAVSAAGGALTAASSLSGNGTGQLLIQGVGPIGSIEYINEVQFDEPQGSVFEIFFNNSTCILPVTLASFTATASPAGTQLRWAASAQINLRSYQPERSTNGSDFTPLGQVTAGTAGRYQYTDLTAPAGTSYYRLKIIDRDNSYAYSSTVAVTVSRTNAKPIVFNSASNTLTVKGLSGNSVITVYTMAGSKLAAVITGRPSETIDASNWPAGLYAIKVVSNDKLIATEKVLKQ